MTPEARVQAAIEILDLVVDGDAAEKALTSWARRSRFAGSKDRAAIRDHVFSVLRKWRSTAALGGAETGRGRMIGLMKDQGTPLDQIFVGGRFGPEPLLDHETGAGRQPDGAEALDLPDWIWAAFQSDLGDQAASVADALRERAPVTLRVNTLKADVAQAQAALAEDGVVTADNPHSPNALTVIEGQRRVAQSSAYQNGLVELQDASSQAIVDFLPDTAPATILDYCAGGGGKALALAARYPDAKIYAWDANRQRMKDIPDRSARAGADITIVDQPSGTYDLVFCDAPCSGSGSWRRAPEAKWRFTQDDLADLVKLQQSILQNAAGFVSDDGALVYATCSVLAQENTNQTDAFLNTHQGWAAADSRFYLPDTVGDGFYASIFTKI